MTCVVMFPGQGAQQRGMGADLFGRFPELVAEADAILGYDLARLCIDDPDDRLDDTRWTQPAMYVVNALAFRAARAEGLVADVAVGHSLGEYNALEAAGVFGFGDGLRLVAARAAAMAAITGGGMSAVIGMPESTLRFLLLRAGFGTLEPANLNTATQIVLAGPGEDLDDVAQILEDAGARMVRRLAVSGPFHSTLMAPAARAVEPTIRATGFATPTIPVLANRTGGTYTPATTADLLVEQIDHPVLWHRTVARLLDDDPDTDFVEIGTSRVLAGLLRQIRRERSIGAAA